MTTVLNDLSIADLRGQLIQDAKALLQTLESNTPVSDLKDAFQKIKSAVEVLLRKEEAAFFNINMELKIPGMDSCMLD